MAWMQKVAEKLRYRNNSECSDVENQQRGPRTKSCRTMLPIKVTVGVAAEVVNGGNGFRGDYKRRNCKPLIRESISYIPKNTIADKTGRSRRNMSTMHVNQTKSYVDQETSHCPHNKCNYSYSCGARNRDSSCQSHCCEKQKKTYEQEFACYSFSGINVSESYTQYSPQYGYGYERSRTPHYRDTGEQATENGPDDKVSYNELISSLQEAIHILKNLKRYSPATRKIILDCVRCPTEGFEHSMFDAVTNIPRDVQVATIFSQEIQCGSSIALGWKPLATQTEPQIVNQKIIRTSSTTIDMPSSDSTLSSLMEQMHDTAAMMRKLVQDNDSMSQTSQRTVVSFGQNSLSEGEQSFLSDFEAPIISVCESSTVDSYQCSYCSMEVRKRDDEEEEDDSQPSSTNGYLYGYSESIKGSNVPPKKTGFNFKKEPRSVSHMKCLSHNNFRQKGIENIETLNSHKSYNNTDSVQLFCSGLRNEAAFIAGSKHTVTRKEKKITSNLGPSPTITLKKEFSRRTHIKSDHNVNNFSRTTIFKPIPKVSLHDPTFHEIQRCGLNVNPRTNINTENVQSNCSSETYIRSYMSHLFPIGLDREHCPQLATI